MHAIARILIIFTILLGTASFVSADGTTVAITEGPATLNPANPLSLTFTLQNQTFNPLVDAITIDFHLSTDDLFDGLDLAIEGVSTSYDALVQAGSCSGDINVLVTCTYSFSVGAPAEGTQYLFVQTATNAITLNTSNAHSILFNYEDLTLNPLVFTPALVSGWSAVPVDLTTSCADTHSPPCTMQYKIGDEAYRDFDGNETISTANGTVTVKARDAVGNEVTLSSPTAVQIDTSTPVIGTVTYPTAWINDTTPDITINATDVGIGAMVAHYKCAPSGTELTKDFSGQSVLISDFDVTANGCSPSSGEREIRYWVTDGTPILHATSEASLTIKYDGAAPTVPGDLDDTAKTTTSVALAWDASTDSGGSGLDEYQIFRATSDSIPSTASNTTESLSQNITGLTCGTTYFFWVKSKDNAGNPSAASSSHSVSTEDCSDTNNNNNNNNNNDNNNDNDNNSPGSNPGPGGGGTCNVTVTVPSQIYAGDTINVSATGASYAGGYISISYPISSSGTTTKKVNEKPAASTEWSGSFDVPNKIGTTVTFRFKGGSCFSQSIIRVIRDPANRAAESAPTVTTQANNPGADVPEASATPPGETSITLQLEGISGLLTLAGYNADNTLMSTDVREAITEWQLIKTLKVVPTADGKFILRITLSAVNMTNQGILKIVENVPKSFASTASMITANVPMTVLKDDPLVQFEFTDLSEGQTVEVTMESSKTYSTVEAANAAMDEIKDDMGTPPLLFASGTAVGSARQGGDAFAGITGLVGGAAASAPLVLGFLVVVGLIMVSVRVVRNSVQETDNPILRSSGRVGMNPNAPRTVNSPIRGKKLWSSNPRSGDDA